MTTSEVAVSDTPLSERQCWSLFGFPLTRTVFVLSDDTLERRRGILSPITVSVNLSQVRGVEVETKQFGLTTIRVATDDPVVSELIIKNIHNGHRFADRLRRCAEASQLAQPHTV